MVALGPWSGDLLKPLGLDPKLDVERGYHRHLKARAGARLSRPVYDADAAYYMAPMEQGYRVTSGVDLSDRDAPDDHRQIDGVTKAAHEAFPFDGVTGETWRGARPTLPDSLPMIGEAPAQSRPLARLRQPAYRLLDGADHGRDDRGADLRRDAAGRSEAVSARALYRLKAVPPAVMVGLDPTISGRMRLQRFPSRDSRVCASLRPRMTP